MLLLRLAFDLDARPADEGRSYFGKPGGGNRIGEPLFDSRVTLLSDLARPDAETAPFTDEGESVSRTVWVDRGALTNLACSRYWAEKQGRAPSAGPANLILEGGTDSVESMIASTERGVLITRFWYIRGLNPRTIAYTGLTRDGTFLIENGKIARPVKNFRFNQSIAEMLKNVEMIGPATRVAAGEDSSTGMPIVAPALKVRDFGLASVSDAI
jgi:predicted Zn-dependent protease